MKNELQFIDNKMMKIVFKQNKNKLDWMMVSYL